MRYVRISIAGVAVFLISLLAGYFSSPQIPSYAFGGPGSQSAGQGTGALGVDASNNLSVGTSSPAANTKFLVMASSSNDAVNFSLRILYPNANPVMVVRNDGRVGIATSTPTSTLTVDGDITVTGNIWSEGGVGAPVSARNVTQGVFGSDWGGGNYAFTGSLGVGTSSQANLPQMLSVYGGGYVQGSLGVGTAFPDTRLHLVSSTLPNIHTVGAFGSTILAEDVRSFVQLAGSDTGSTVQSALLLSLVPASGANKHWVVGHLGPSANNRFMIGYLTTSGGFFNLNPSEYFTVTTGGNVGIGATSPNSLLEVGSGGYFQMSRTSSGAPPSGDCDSDSERGRMVIDTNSNRLYVCNGASRGWDYAVLTN